MAHGLTCREEAGAPVAETVRRLRTAGPLVFFGAMAVLPAVGFPLMPFVLAAGPVFGPVLGIGNTLTFAILALAINVSLGYGIAAFVLRERTFRLIEWLGFRHPDLGRLSDWQVTMLVRLLPGPPFWVQNYLLGVLRVGFLPYLLLSTLVPTVYVVGVVTGGDALMRGRNGLLLFALAIVGIAAILIRMWRQRLQARE